MSWRLILKKSLKPKKIAVGLFFILLFSFFPLTQGYIYQSEKQILFTYSFKCPTTEIVNIQGTIYDRIFLTGCTVASNPGEPNIPSKGAYILLPPKSKVNDIKIIPGVKHILGTGFNIDPVGEPIKMTETYIVPKLSKDTQIYNLNNFYPGRLFTEVGTYSFRGYQILVLLLHPIQYNPVTGELYYYENMQVTVQTCLDNQANTLFRGFERDLQEVMKKVDNPNAAKQYLNEIVPISECRDSLNLLILTTDSLKSGFDPLKQAHDANGVNTVIKTLSDIGSSDLDDIRDYIEEEYMNWGIDYVLIGGDADVFPAPILWVLGMDENTTPYEEYMPADLFYACLDGPYNYDEDDKWGEPNDGEGGGDVDLIAEVYVGRACVDNVDDVNNFVTKTIAYINKNPDDEYLKKVCLAGEYMGDYGIASYSGTYLDQLVDGSEDDGYTTVGIPGSEYDITKLYDAPGYEWPPSDIISIINSGTHIINHLGHSSFDYNMKLYNYDVSMLTNDDYCFIYSQGCDAGGFDDPYGYYDCIAEVFTVKTQHGAFAGIWNARYGFFWSYSTDGDNQRFHRQFWDAVFGENITEIGRANHDSKEDNLCIINRSCMRYCYYELNLFGDPTLRFFEVEHPNSPPNIPTVLGPIGGKPDIAYDYIFNTEDPDGDEVKYVIDWDDGSNYTTLLCPSGTDVTAFHIWSSPGTYYIIAKAIDEHGLESDWSTPLMMIITKNKNRQINTPFLHFLQNFLENHPNLSPILQKLLQR
jgi:hypothetical protein